MTSESWDPYGPLAEFYDLDLGDFDDDLGLYLGFAKHAEGPVLELGCGTGRVALALTAEGHEVTGIDLSEAMLEVARAKAAQFERSPEFTHADMRSFDLGRQFALAIVPLGGIRHLLTLEEQTSTFASVRHHLVPGGLLVLDLPAWHTLPWEPEPGPLHLEWTRRYDQGGATVTKFSSVHPDPAAQIQYLTMLFDEHDPDGVVRRLSVEMPLYTFTRSELKLLLDQAGLAPVGWYGSYDLGPYDSNSARLIVIAQRGGA